MAWRRRLCRYHAVGEDTPSRRPSSIAEIPCLVLVIRCIARNQWVSGSLVSAITVPEVTDQRWLQRVQPTRRLPPAAPLPAPPGRHPRRRSAARTPHPSVPASSAACHAPRIQRSEHNRNSALLQGGQIG